MMATVIIPTRQDLKEYREQITLDGFQFDLLFTYNLREGAWYLDISDIEGTAIRHGIKLVTSFPVLRTVQVEGRPEGEMVIVDTTGANTAATLTNLGVDVVLAYVEGT